jgi:hypothetical protein
MRENSSFFALVFFSCLCLLSCGTTAAPVTSSLPGPAGNGIYGLAETAFWDAAPLNNELIFHGAAGLLSDREESIRLALEDAARKLAVFHTVEGVFYAYTHIGGGALDYRSDIQTALNYDQDYKRYVEELDFDPERDVLQRGNVIFVRARYRPPVPVSIPYTPPPFGENGKPGWIDNPPHISGYAVGLGYAGRRSSPGDTVNKSFESAAFSIIKNTSSLVSGRTESFQGSGAYDVSSTNRSALLARGVLRGFYALDTWTDPQTQGVWILALAREASQY